MGFKEQKKWTQSICVEKDCILEELGWRSYDKNALHELLKELK